MTESEFWRLQILTSKDGSCAERVNMSISMKLILNLINWNNSKITVPFFLFMTHTFSDLHIVFVSYSKKESLLAPKLRCWKPSTQICMKHLKSKLLWIYIMYTDIYL